MLKPPLPRSSKPRLLKAPPITPAFRPTTPIGLRPEKDSNSISFASIVLRTATSVWSGVASAVTVTTSEIVPVSSRTSTEVLEAASRITPVRTHFLKPWSSTASSYRPGESAGQHVIPAAVGDHGAHEAGLGQRRRHRGARNDPAALILDEAGDLAAVDLGKSGNRRERHEDERRDHVPHRPPPGSRTIQRTRA